MIDEAALKSGNRRALAKAITLVESKRPDDQEQAQSLLTKILPVTGNSIRIGITGVPGVGKSTFIEALGLHLIAQGHRVAVLAVDPSSPIKGGSILGDKTRMEELSRREQAFIRPSPSEGFSRWRCPKDPRKPAAVRGSWLRCDSGRDSRRRPIRI